MHKKYGTPLRFFVILLSVWMLTTSLAQARKSQAELAEQIVHAHNLLGDMMADAEKSIPTELIAKAKGILFIDRFQAGFIFGIKGGQAVGMIHDGNGNWSAPAFYRVGGGSFGLQIGGERRETILLLMDDGSTRIMTGDSGEVGVDFGVAAGPKGANSDTTNLRESAYAYTFASGLYAGATIQGGVISPSNQSNSTYYERNGVTALDILEGRVSMPEAAVPLVELLRIYSEQGKTSR